jgi:3-isopropylmalate dehydrogenase
MMLKYSLCEPELAAAVDQAVRQTIDKGVMTRDINGSSSTSEVGDAIAAELSQILKESS